MKKCVVFGFACLSIFVVSFSVSAQESLKVAYVNVAQVFSASPQRASAVKAIEKEFSARQEKMKALQQEVIGLRDKYNREAVTMSESDLTKLQEKLLTTDRKLRWEQGVYEEDLKIRRQQVLGKVQKDIGAALRKIGQSGKYDLILNEGVLFSSSRVDITKDVIEQLKK